MNRYLKLLFSAGVVLLSASCQSQPKQVIIPAVEVRQPVEHALEVIGGVEPVYFLPIKAPFSARIDTGAETSSIDVTHMRFFERDGEKWVSFDLNHDENGKKHMFEKPIVRRVNIRRIEGNEHRVVVMLDVKIGTEIINAEFTLANRTKFTYQALIGRNILNGRFIVDPSIENTLH